jgi:uncharacterized protein (TIGR02266 family)
MPDDFDRRRSARVKVHLSVTVLEPQTTIHMTVASDLSSGGMFIHQLLPFDVGTPMELQFELPGAGRKVVAQAKVVQKREEFMEGMPDRPIGNGLRFTYLSLADTEAIEQYVDAREGDDRPRF